MADKWARVIAGAYGGQANPPLSLADQDLLASQLAERLTVPITSGGDWNAHANLVLNAWERRRGGEGPRLLAVNTEEGAARDGPSSSWPRLISETSKTLAGAARRLME